LRGRAESLVQPVQHLEVEGVTFLPARQRNGPHGIFLLDPDCAQSILLEPVRPRGRSGRIVRAFACFRQMLCESPSRCPEWWCRCRPERTFLLGGGKRKYLFRLYLVAAVENACPVSYHGTELR